MAPLSALWVSSQPSPLASTAKREGAERGGAGGRRPLSQMGKLRLGGGVWRSCQQWRLLLASVTTGGGARPPGIRMGLPRRPPVICGPHSSVAPLPPPPSSPTPAEGLGWRCSPWDRHESLLTPRRSDRCAPEKICDFPAQKGEDCSCIYCLSLPPTLCRPWANQVPLCASVS